MGLTGEYHADCSMLLRELAWHKEQLDLYKKRVNERYEKIHELRAENEALRPDAERYRAIRQYLELRQHAGIWWLGETNNIGHGAFSSIDAAIDAMRGEVEK